LIGGDTGSVGPPYIWGGLEEPQGEKKVDGVIERYYNAEQQVRLGVNEVGRPVARGSPQTQAELVASQTWHDLK